MIFKKDRSSLFIAEERKEEEEGGEEKRRFRSHYPSSLITFLQTKKSS